MLHTFGRCSGPPPADLRPHRRGKGIYGVAVAYFFAWGAESPQINIEGERPATLQAGLRRALKGREAQDAKLAERGEETHLVRQVAK